MFPQCLKSSLVVKIQGHFRLWPLPDQAEAGESPKTLEIPSKIYAISD